MNHIKNHLHKGSIRVNTRASQPRTSSNQSFQEKFRSSVGAGLNLTNNAMARVLRPLPGSAALTASLSDAASSLSSSSSLSGMNNDLTSRLQDNDTGSLQDEMLKNNNDLLETQMRVLHATTAMNTRSHIVKAMYDTLKTIGSNIR